MKITRSKLGMRFNSTGLRLSLLGLTLALFTSPVYGQSSTQSDEESQQFRVFKLSSIKAETVLQTVEDLFPDSTEPFKLAYDAESNGIIVRGDKTQIEKIATLIELIDQPTAEAEEGELKVYDLKYMEVRSAADVLMSLLKGESTTRLSAEPRLNRMIVFGSKAVHDRVEQVLAEIDMPATETGSSVLKVAPDSRGGIASRDLLYSAAEGAGVKLELMPQLGIAVARGAKGSVEEFRQEVEAVLEAANVNVAASQSKNRSRNLLVRVVWLAEMEEGKALPESMAPIAARAAEFGIKDLRLMGQLVGSTSVAEESGQEFQMSGQTSAGIKFVTSGSIASAEDQNQVAGFISLWVTDGFKEDADPVAELSLNLPIGRPSIVASAPIAGTASVFVIEVLDNSP
ncbi:MAG: secretin N-terminal domain-containing protein [Planctomycetota bacterium]